MQAGPFMTGQVAADARAILCGLNQHLRAFRWNVRHSAHFDAIEGIGDRDEAGRYVNGECVIHFGTPLVVFSFECRRSQKSARTHAQRVSLPVSV
jgi:hypothetical protein